MKPEFQIAATEESPGSVPALDRTLDILETLSSSPKGLTLSELSQQLEIPKNAVFRITQTLLARRYLSRDAETMAFQLTGQWLKLATPRMGGMSLAALARPAMTALRDATGETVQLGVLSGLEGTIIEQVEGTQPLRIVVDLGLRFGLHNNAPGKLLLAHLADEKRDQVLSQLKLTASTPRTITTKAELRKECERIVSQGYSIDHAEADEGIHCIAAPIVSEFEGVVAALWLTGPAKRLPKSRFRELGEQVRAAGKQVSRQIEQLG
jgi:DNA-binding IclR family transcriptional regulator